MIIQATCGLYFWRVEIQMKQSNIHIAIFSILILGLAGNTLPAYASDAASKNMDVSVDITETCNMSNTDLNFGGYDAFGANATRDLLTTAKITTTCTSGTTAYVTMDNGLHSTREQRIDKRSIHYTDYRHMSNAGSDSKLQYELYTNENHTTVWHVNLQQEIVGSGASENLPVYAKVFKNQRDAEAGSYTDTINITLNY